MPGSARTLEIARDGASSTASSFPAPGHPFPEESIPSASHRVETRALVGNDENQLQAHHPRDFDQFRSNSRASDEPASKTPLDRGSHRWQSELASPSTDYASVQRAAAMATPDHISHAVLPPQRGQMPNVFPLPGIPSSLPATSQQQRRRGWLGWVFGGGDSRPPKKRVRNALV